MCRTERRPGELVGGGADDVIAVRWAGLGLGLVWRAGSGRLGEKMESQRVGFCLGDWRPWSPVPDPCALSSWWPARHYLPQHPGLSLLARQGLVRSTGRQLQTHAPSLPFPDP